ncbi:MAG: polysaccharide deacetylase family protein [bacterium]|nr:polysaccharide deacetylase family protein [bacterium]
MRNWYILIIFFAVTVAIGIGVYYKTSNLAEYIGGNEKGWEYKEKEIKSRLSFIPIILYHNIDGKGPFSIDREVLRQHFQTIKDNNIRVISLSALIERLEDPVPFKDKVMAITFDDGYLSIYTKLLPLVKEFGYPVTLFVYTDFIRTRGTKSMTWKTLRKLEKEGIDVQCHSTTHDDLTLFSGKDDYESKKKLFEELYLSKRIIELYLGKKITLFAFPYGRYDADIIKMSQLAGYRRTFSTNFGSNVITRDNFSLKRHHIKKGYSLERINEIIDKMMQ